MKNNLLEAKHGSVESGTGTGKSLLAVSLIKTIGLQTLIMVPSLSIAKQMYDDFLKAFGTKYVGQFNGKKKQINKLITIGVDASLANLVPGTDAWQFFSETKVLITDESHLVPADTLQEVCLGVVKNAPYRFFLSGTQLRNDGLDIVLNGIIGPIVDHMTVREGVDSGWLAKPIFKIIPVESKNSYRSKDINRMTSVHLYNNKEVNRLAAMIANKSVSAQNRQVLILIDEMEQFVNLLPHFKYEVEFAHGPLTKEHKKYIPSKYFQSIHKN